MSESNKTTPRSFGLRALAVVGVLSAAVTAGGTVLVLRLRDDGPPELQAGDNADTGEEASQAAEQWQCPMHPGIVQDHPGKCPICGMNLVKIAAQKQAASATASERKILFYRNPHDPKQTSPVPSKDSMGMDYLPVYASDVGSGDAVKGVATVEIDPQRQQLIGLRSVAVMEGPVGADVRTNGRVAVDETRVRKVNIKVAGFVERIHVNFVGQRVRRGDPLFTLYSPELLSAQEEYLLALRTRSALTAGGSLLADGEDLVRAARRKLALWDVPAAEIDRIARRGEPSKALTFYSPVNGVVTKKDVLEGSQLAAGATPYEIVDLSQVWVLADVYERELRHVREGMNATLRLQALPNQSFTGEVLFMDPILDPATRTARVRLAFPNPGGELRPEMFGEVTLQSRARRGLLIPADAVVDSGTEKVVFVAAGDGKFQPRRVRTGASNLEGVEVLSGLTAGEEVVTRANFLIDSEARLRASLAEMADASAKPDAASMLPGESAGQGKLPTAPGNGGAGHDHGGR